MTLRKAMLWRTLAFSAVTFTACFSLVVLTTLMRRTTDEVIRIGDERALAGDLANQVMSESFATTPEGRVVSEARGRRLLTRIEDLARTSAERRPLALLVPLLDRAWSEPGAPPILSRDLMIALEHLEGVADDEARRVHARARDLDALSNVLGMTLAGLLAAALGFSVWWLHHFVSRPLDGLARSVDRFAHGELDARAPEQGVAELRQVAHAHNEMADAVARTRMDQLQYVATVVHDLRGPLAALQLASGYVSPERPLPPEHRIRELFAIIGRQLTRLNSVVGDVLAAVQVDAGSMVLREEPCDAGELARKCLAQFEAVAPTHRFELTSSGPMDVVADKRRLEQVIDNLVSNAVKYSPPGSLVSTAIQGSDTELRIAVTDHGSGIDSETKSQLFQPFWRGRSLHVEVPGVGLGLYVSNKIVEAHGGTLDVVSTLGKGSTFTVTLPRRRPA